MGMKHPYYWVGATERDYFLRFFSYFLRRSWMASKNKSVKVLSVTTLDGETTRSWGLPGTE
jgi:hypothetical protein